MNISSQQEHMRTVCARPTRETLCHSCLCRVPLRCGSGARWESGPAASARTRTPCGAIPRRWSSRRSHRFDLCQTLRSQICAAATATAPEYSFDLQSRVTQWPVARRWPLSLPNWCSTSASWGRHPVHSTTDIAVTVPRRHLAIVWHSQTLRRLKRSARSSCSKTLTWFHGVRHG